MAKANIKLLSSYNSIFKPVWIKLSMVFIMNTFLKKVHYVIRKVEIVYDKKKVI